VTAPENAGAGGRRDDEVTGDLHTILTQAGEPGQIEFVNAPWRTVRALASELCKAKGITLEVRMTDDLHDQVMGHFGPDGNFAPTDNDDPDGP